MKWSVHCTPPLQNSPGNNLAILWKSTHENTSKTCKRHKSSTSDFTELLILSINIDNKYWYHSLHKYTPVMHHTVPCGNKNGSKSVEIPSGILWPRSSSNIHAFLSGILQAPIAYLNHSKKMSLRWEWVHWISKLYLQPEHLNGSQQGAQFWSINLLPSNWNFPQWYLQHFRNL